MADDTSLLLRIRGDSSGGTKAVQEARQAISQLRASSVSDLKQIQNASTSSLGSITQSVSQISSGIPLIGNALSGVASQVTSFTSASEGAAAGITSMVGPIGLAVGAFAALAGGIALAAKELFEISKHAAEFQGRMIDLSQATGLGVETLSTLEIAAKTTGGSLDSIAASLGIFQKKLEDAEDPGSKSAATLKRIGVEATDTETALRQTLAAIARMPEGFEQTAVALELFGRGGKQVLAILKETNGDLDAFQRKLRDAGILITSDAARSADKLNDELALLDFQARSAGAEIAKELIPPLADLARNAAELVRAAKPLLGVIGEIGGPVVRTAAGALRGLSIVVIGLTGDYKELRKAIKEANEEAEKLRDIPAITIPALSPVPLSQTTSLDAAKEAAQLADAVVAAAKRSAKEQNQILSELFEQGRINRQKQADETIAANKRVLDADKARIQALLDQKDAEVKAIRKREDLSEAAKLSLIRTTGEEAQKLQQEQLDAESLFETTSREIRARAAKERADSQRNQVRNDTDILIGEFDRQIRVIEAQIDRQEIVESDGLSVIEQLEQAKIDARRDSLEQQKQIGFLSVQDQKDLNNQLQTLNQEADRLQDEQRARRLQKDREAAVRSRQIKLAEIDTTLELQRIVGERTIATIEAQARLRIKSEEQTARDILQLKLDLIDQEIKATEAKVKATKSIVDVNERTAVETELNGRLKILAEERKTIQAEGNRNIEDGRQEDLSNERAYADDLKEIQERIEDIQRDTADEVIRLMRLHFAKRKDVIRAQRDLELADEAARHKRVTDSIRQQQREVDEQIAFIELHLKAIKIGTTEEIEQYERLIEELEKLKLKRAELAAQRDAEDKRSESRTQRTKAEAEQAERDRQGIFIPGNRLPRIGTDEDEEDTNAATEGMKAAFRDLKEVGLDAFSSLAQGIGNLVENYVLLGTTGPAALRKLLAATLAQIAAESAVKAIYWTAQGIVDLFFNPARAAADFTAAALFASIAGVATIAGRSVAGNLFKPNAGGAGGSGTSDRGQLNPLTLNRNQPEPQRLIVEFRVRDSEFGRAISAHVVKDITHAGPIRETLANDGKF